MSKKIIALLLAAVMVFALTACGQEAAAPEPTAAPAAPATSTPAAPAATPAAPAETPAAAETPAKDEKYGGDLIYATSSVSNTMDPHFCATLFANHIWMQNVVEAPLCHSDGGDIYPLICDYDISDDGTVLKLTVRDYCFSNGQKVTIDDVVASLDRCASVDARFAENYWDYLVDTKVDGDTVTYTFSQMIPTLLWELSNLQGTYVLPKEICEKYGTNEIMDIADVIGTGPYVLKEYTPDVHVVVARNEYYVPTMNDATGPAAPRMAYADTITYAINKDSASTTAAMIAGDYHIGGIMSSMADYASQLGLKMDLIRDQWTHGIKFNMSDVNSKSPIANVNVRKAIRAVLDSEAALIAVNQSDDSERFELDPNPLIASNKVYYNTIITDNEWNVRNKELAKKYLEEANYNGEEIVWMCSAGGGYERIATVEIPLLEEVGLNVSLKLVDSGSVAGLRSDPGSGWDICYFCFQKSTYHPATGSFLSPTMYGLWNTEAHQEAYGRLLNSPTASAESVQAYKDLCQLVADEVPWVGFGNANSTTFTQANVNWDFTGIEEYLWNAYFED